MVVPSDSAFDPAVHLAYGDVLADSNLSPKFLEVKIKASKTDLFRVWVSVFLGRTYRDLCPVAAVLGYMVRRRTAPGIFFQFKNGKLQTQDQFIAKMRDAVRYAGVDATKYAGHSFRVGVATMAAQQGVSDSLKRWEGGRVQLTRFTSKPRGTHYARCLGLWWVIEYHQPSSFDYWDEQVLLVVLRV